MELSNYELVRYPSGQLIITKVTKGSSFRDVVGAYTNEADAQRALERLVAEASPAVSNRGPEMTRAA
ncbi:MAG: hypothetical protein EKK41_05850 [Hyphomicrobiales bacterium]|jgi:hypothetical protein|nr:MAG: hypothetical protein EKK41_05850 [Hyphomicrobiales bacterium]